MGIRLTGGVLPSGTITVGKSKDSVVPYPAAKTFNSWSQESRLVNTDPQVAATDQFGTSLAISSFGTTLLVGALGADKGTLNTGAAFVYEYTGGSWQKQATLLGNDRAANDYEGISVALSYDGNTAVVGAYQADVGLSNSGAVYVFVRDGVTWTQQAKLYPNDRVAGDLFGASVAVSADGNTVVAATNQRNTRTGKAYVFTRTGTTWTQKQGFTPADMVANDSFGAVVAISGNANTIAVTAYSDDNLSGSVYIYTKSGSTYNESRKIKPTDTASASQFGSSLALSWDGGTLAVGSRGKDDIGTDSGAAYVFTGSGVTWTQAAKLNPSSRAAGDNYGYSIAISADGHYVLVGSPYNDTTNPNAGTTFMFTDKTGTWVQKAQLMNNERKQDDNTGMAVALSGNGQVAVQGSPLAYTYENNVSREDAGIVHILRGA